jgi:pimeloyl-ACP methyl ester carboxylesterase
MLNHIRQGRGEPMLLIHGIGSRWQVWQPVLGRVSAERDVIAIDLPGFGTSQALPAGAPRGVEPLTDAIVAFLDEHDLGSPHVGGNSLGGWIALELAKRGRARSVTALSPAGFWNRPEALFCRSSLMTAVRGARRLTTPLGFASRFTIGRAFAFGQLIQHPSRIPYEDAIASLHALAKAPDFDATAAAMTAEKFRDGGQISVPVTIAWAQHDRLLLRRQAKRAARQVPRARMATLAGCGHVPTWDDPEQVARGLLEGSSAG